MRRATSHACLALAALALSGCGAATRMEREAAADLACAERAYLADGDLDRAERCLERALAHGAGSAEASFLAADLLDATGRPAEALPHYLETLEIAHREGGNDAVAEASAMAVVAIRDRVEGFAAVFDGLMERLGDRAGRLPPQAWFQLRNLALGLALRSGKGDLEQLARRAGCVDRWQLAGPFGSRVWERFDRPHALESGGPWPASVDLGPGRGTSRVREGGVAVPCAVAIGDPRLGFEGVGYARTVVPLDRPRRVLFRLETGGAARVRIGGSEVFFREPRSGWPPIASWFAVRLPAGNNEIVITVADPTSSPSFSLHALDATGEPLPAATSPEPIPTAAPSAPLPIRSAPGGPTSTHARLRIALWNGDRDDSAALLEELTDGAAQQAPILLQAAAEALSADPSLPGESSYELARALMEQALDTEPRLWQARRFLSRHEEMEGRPHEAFALLTAGRDLVPDEPALVDELAELVAGAGWRAESIAAVGELERLLPTACRTLSWKLVLARQRSDFEGALAIAEQLARCDAGSTALAEELTRRQRFDDALAEYRRIAGRQEDNAAALSDVAGAAVAAGRRSAAVEPLAQALEQVPGSAATREALADAMLAGGRREEALDLIDRGLAELPGSDPALLRARAAIRGEPLFAALRIDGAAVVRRYREQDPGYDTAAVWVLDRSVSLVGRDGSRVELIHSIVHLKTDEALEKHGEFSIPADALLLTGRTIKQDGRTLEPEEIANKPSVSFPDLMPGDFIEIEYAVFHPGSPLFPGGFDTGRFYFQDFETAFHRSEILVIAPAEMNLQIDPRGECPAPTERRLGDLRSLTWRARGLLPRALEPLSPVAREYLPSIRVAAAADWGEVTSRIRDMLEDLERPCPQLTDAAEDALLGIAPEDHAARRRALYHWVMEHVEESGDLFEQACHVAVRKAGSRARLFVALLEAVGYSGRLAMVREAGEDETESQVPSLAYLDRVAVRVEGDGWVSLEQEGAPYGYLPPELRRSQARFFDDGAETRTDGGSVPIDRQVVAADIDLRPDGSATAVIREELTGVMAAGWRQEFREIPGAEIEKVFEESYLGSAVAGAALTSLHLEGLDDPEAPLTIHYEIEVAQLGKREGQQFRVAVPFPITLVERIGALPARTTPAVLASRIEKTVAATIAIPRGYRASAREAEGSVRSAWGEASKSIDTSGEVVRARYEARLEADRVAPKSYVEFLSFARELDRLTALEFDVTPVNP